MNNRQALYNPKEDPILISFNQFYGKERTPEAQEQLSELIQSAHAHMGQANGARQNYLQAMEASAMLGFMGASTNMPAIDDGQGNYLHAIHLYAQAVKMGDESQLVNLAEAIIVGKSANRGDRAAVYYRVAHDLGIARAKAGFESLKYLDGFYIDYHRLFVNENATAAAKFIKLALKQPVIFKHIMLTSGDSWRDVKKLLPANVIDKLLQRETNLQVRLQVDAKLPAVLADIIVDYAEATTVDRDHLLKRDIQTAVNLQIKNENDHLLKVSDSKHSILFAWKAKRDKILKAQEAMRASDTWLWSQPAK